MMAQLGACPRHARTAIEEERNHHLRKSPIFLPARAQHMADARCRWPADPTQPRRPERPAARTATQCARSPQKRLATGISVTGSASQDQRARRDVSGPARQPSHSTPCVTHARHPPALPTHRAELRGHKSRVPQPCSQRSRRVSARLARGGPRPRRVPLRQLWVTSPPSAAASGKSEVPEGSTGDVWLSLEPPPEGTREADGKKDEEPLEW